ncbi:MAG: ferrochelatase [Methanobacteriota archaeon]
MTRATARSATGVLLMAVGGPSSLDDVEGFLKDVRRGRPTPKELVEEFRARYGRIGGRSPLLEISRAQANALENRLRELGTEYPCYVAMRNWHPHIRDVLPEIARDGVRRIVALCLTPYYSRMSVGAYFVALQEGLRMRKLPMDVSYVESWNDEPALVAAYAARIRDGLDRFAAQGIADPVVLFSAHSLPRKIMEDRDPYERELAETREAILARLPRLRTRMAYQSAGRTEEPWLGPTIEDTLDELGKAGERAVLVAPFGFVSDNVEILYDIDIEAKERAEKWGMRLERAESLNTDARFVEAMARVVLDAAPAE